VFLGLSSTCCCYWKAECEWVCVCSLSLSLYLVYLWTCHNLAHMLGFKDRFPLCLWSSVQMRLTLPG
jgi:uncharacterized protein with PQ loop repeat